MNGPHALRTARVWPIRAYLLALMISVALPLIALICFLIFSEVRSAVNMAGDRSLEVAETVARRAERFLAESEAVMTGLARRPGIRAMDPSRPDPVIATFQNQTALYPQFANLLVVDLSGRVIQSGVAQREGSLTSVADTQWFLDARKKGGYLVGDPFVGAITHKWVSVLGYPIRNDAGTVIGLLALPIDLAWYQAEVNTAGAPKSAVVTIVDRQGFVIARSSDTGRWVGRKMKGNEIVDLALAGKRGKVRARGLDGVDRFYGFTTIPTAGWRVYAGIPAEEVFAPIKGLALRGALFLGLVVILVTLLCVRIARTIALPVQHLAGAAAAVAAGALESRARLEGPAEIAAVARQFNEMLDIMSFAQSDLRTSEGRLTGIITSAMDAIITVDAGQRIVLFNAAAEKMFSIPAAEALGGPIDRFIPDRFRARHRDDLERFRESAVSTRTMGVLGAISGLRATGEEFPIEASISRVEVRGASLATVIIRDITVRVQQERALARGNRLYAVLTHINQAIVRATSREELFDEVCRVLVEQGEFRTAWIGWHDPETHMLVPAGMAGGSAASISVRADEPEGRGPTGTAFREGRPQICNRLLEDASTALWAAEAERLGLQAAAVFPIRSMNEIVGTLSVYAAAADHFQESEVALLEEAAADISFALDNLTRSEQRRTAERARKDAEKRLRLVVDNMAQGLMVFTPDKQVLEWNPAALRIQGFSSEQEARRMLPELAGLFDVSTMDGRLLPPEEHPVGRVLRGETMENVVVKVTRRDTGHTRVVSMSGSMLLREDAGPLALITMNDITERVEARAELDRSEKKARTVLSSLTEGVVFIHSGGKVELMNHAVERILGRQSGELDERKKHLLLQIVRSDGSLFPPDERPATIAQRENQSVRGVEMGVPRADGSLVWVSVNAEPVRDESGVATGVVVSLVDITGRRDMEATLKLSHQRLQALAKKLLFVQEAERRQIARELHDEIGQVLTAAKINLQSLQRFPDPAELSQRLDDSVRIVDRALGQVRSLSLKLHPAILDDLGLAAAVRWLADQHALRAGVLLTVTDEIGGARFDPALEIACFRIIQEALNNIVKHARASAVTIDLREADGVLHLRVRDDGQGFDVAKGRERARRGASLGILSMEERATLASGRVEWQSQAGEGTEVHAWFPGSSQEGPP